MNVVIPYQLFGPMPQGFTWVPNNFYQAPGASFSASTKQFSWLDGSPPIASVNWSWSWAAFTSHKARLSMRYFPDGVSTVEHIAEFSPTEPTGAPRPQGVDVSDYFRGLRTANRLCIIYHEFIGDGVQPLTLHEACITVAYKVGHYGEIGQ